MSWLSSTPSHFQHTYLRHSSTLITHICIYTPKLTTLRYTTDKAKLIIKIYKEFYKQLESLTKGSGLEGGSELSYKSRPSVLKVYVSF